MAITDWLLCIQHFLASNEDVTLLDIRLLVFARNRAVQIFESFRNLLQVLLEKLIGDDFQVADGLDITFVMDDLLVGEGPDNVVDTIDGLNMRQECVAEALSLRGTRHKTSDIKDGD